jgi:hypothetical protein
MRSVAVIIGTDHQYIDKVEAGRGIVLSELILLCDIYGITAERVINALVAKLN